MARENLPTNYVNYELATAMGGMRRFNQINNSDGTISFEDATTYSVTGTTYGANEINTANALINEINELVGTTSISGSGQTDITSLLGGTDITNATLGIGDGTVTGAISELNSNLTNLLSWTKLGSANTTSGKTLTFTPSRYKEYLLIASNDGSRILASSQIPYSYIAIGSVANGGYHQTTFAGTYGAGVNFTSTGAVLFSGATTNYGILFGR